MPASTSPDPAVPRLAGALALIAARPSGAAITVSPPLRMTTAPERAAAARACSTLLPAIIAEQPLELALVRRQHHRPVQFGLDGSE